MRKAKLSVVLLSVVIILLMMFAASMVSAAVPRLNFLELTPIGNPIWEPVDFHMFFGEIGTPESGFEESLQLALSLLPPPEHELVPGLGVGPGSPHPAPYDQELKAGINANGFREKSLFRRREFTGDQGIYVVWMNVPRPGVVGSSPDFASGPIIPDTLFPIHVQGITYRNKQEFDPFLASFDVPKLSDAGFAVDGHSHFPMFIWENAAFGPPDSKINGRYLYEITMIDQSGNGWLIETRFMVRP